MSRIRGSNTRLELLVRRALHARGFRYRLGGAGLPGRPDIVLSRYRTVVFVHGCFWHGHDCPLFRLPKTRPEFWREKIEANRSRDERALTQLREEDWHAVVVWECSLRGVAGVECAKYFDELARQIRNVSRWCDRQSGSAGEKGMMQSNPEESIWSMIEDLAAGSSRLFLKKLSRNDTSWADDPSKHQAGFYIPSEIRESGFFPPLTATNPDKPHIYFAPCLSLWPQTGEVKRSGMRHYSNKGPETHFTVVPHDLFVGLSPASLLLAGKLRPPVDDATHWFVVIDSKSSDAEILETTLNIASDFHFGLFNPSRMGAARALAVDEASELINQLHHAIRTGTLTQFVQSVSRIPTSAQIAAEARQHFFAVTGAASLNPYELANPGDAIMRISRDIEYEIFKRYELRRRASEIVELLIREPDAVTAVVRGFPLMDAIFLSASQQRKTRAGRSFESHLAATLKDGRIEFEEQAVLGGRRPDFVLPNKRIVGLRESRPFVDALILSAKTTLRERWKQITHERFNCAIFLATVDDRVSRQALDEMQTAGIGLVVPESLKTSKETHYSTHQNVIPFREFFDQELATKRPYLF